MPDNPETTAQDLPNLIQKLDSKQMQERQQAFGALKAAGESALPYLVEALADPRTRVRFAAGQILAESKLGWARLATGRTVAALLADLTCPDGFNRLMARRGLVHIGKPAVPFLTRSLEDKEPLRRWEAAKTLSEIGDAQATDALIKALTDKVFDVRWLAAEGLCTIGVTALPALLKAVIKNPESIWLREGAHHILHELNNERISAVVNPLMRALVDSDANLEVPLLAKKALDVIEKIL